MSDIYYKHVWNAYLLDKDKIKTRLKEIGINQHVLGYLTGISKSTMSEFMRGKTYVSEEKMISINRVLRWE